MLLILSLLITFGLAGCQSAPPVIKTVLPQTLSEPPNLESCIQDRNDKTGEEGFWLNRGDMIKESVWRETVRSTVIEFRK